MSHEPWAFPVAVNTPPDWALQLIRTSYSVSGIHRAWALMLLWGHCLWGWQKGCRGTRVRCAVPDKGWRMTFRYYYGCSCGWTPFPREKK